MKIIYSIALMLLFSLFIGCFKDADRERYEALCKEVNMEGEALQNALQNYDSADSETRKRIIKSAEKRSAEYKKNKESENTEEESED